jgi:hypothetical protein
MLVAASVAITGGIILVGLAAAVSELRRALRHLRVPDRRDVERGQGRRMEPRVDRPVAHGADAVHVIPARFDAPEAEPREPRRKPAQAPERTAPERTAPETLDAIRPADYRMPGNEASGQGTEVPAAAGAAADEVKSPPLSPADAAASATASIKPPSRVLKSGIYNDVAYTLFSDGSIETPTPEGTLRFASIDDFRKHLEKSAG